MLRKNIIIITVIFILMVKHNAHANFFIKSNLNTIMNNNKINGKLEANEEKFNFHTLDKTKNKKSIELGIAAGYNFNINKNNNIDLEIEYLSNNQDKQLISQDKNLFDFSLFIENKIRKIMLNGYYNLNQFLLKNNKTNIKPLIMIGIGIGQYNTKIGANFKITPEIDFNLYHAQTIRDMFIIGQIGLGVTIPITENIEIIGMYSINNKIGSNKKIQNIINTIYDDINISANIQKEYVQNKSILSLKINF